MKKETCKMFSYRLMFQKSKLVSLPRFYCNNPNKPAVRSSIKKSEEETTDFTVYDTKLFSPATVKYWNERSAVKKQIRSHRFPQSVDSAVELIKFFQSLNSFPSSFKELLYSLKKRKVKHHLIAQKYLPQRVAVLKPDLAAAHFIVNRGGSVKFVGNPEWIGAREKKVSLPMSYVPGMFVEAIKAERTTLYTEGLQNLFNLHYLSYLSLKNLDTVDDWFLDLLSKGHYYNLKHLDISGCKNVTYRGLSCFYRFENLEILEVEGIPDTTEFKLGCLMLLQIMPYLDIRGIDLSVPKEIKPSKIEGKEIDTNVEG